MQYGLRFRLPPHFVRWAAAQIKDLVAAETTWTTPSTTASRAIQLDHVVALSDSWQKGAQQWDEDTRRNFANDPINLIAVDGPTNASKGDGDAATWQPPNKAFRCEYAAMQIRVKSTYGLWVTQAERDALQANLDRC